MTATHQIVHDLLRQLAAGEGVRPTTVRVDVATLRLTVQIMENLVCSVLSDRGMIPDVREADACVHTLRGILGDAAERPETPDA